MTLNFLRNDKGRSFVIGITYTESAESTCPFKHSVGLHFIFWMWFLKWGKQTRYRIVKPTVEVGNFTTYRNGKFVRELYVTGNFDPKDLRPNATVPR